MLVLMSKKEKGIEIIFDQMVGMESGEEKEFLKEEFFSRLKKKKTKDEPLLVYEPFIKKCMVKAAQADDEEVFDWLFDSVSRMNILVELDRKYVYKIIERFGMENHTWEAENASVGFKIPGIYAAILNGDIELVRFYTRHGAALKPDHTEEFLMFGGSAGIVHAIHMNENYPAF